MLYNSNYLETFIFNSFLDVGYFNCALFKGFILILKFYQMHKWFAILVFLLLMFKRWLLCRSSLIIIMLFFFFGKYFFSVFKFWIWNRNKKLSSATTKSWIHLVQCFIHTVMLLYILLLCWMLMILRLQLEFYELHYITLKMTFSWNLSSRSLHVL